MKKLAAVIACLSVTVVMAVAQVVDVRGREFQSGEYSSPSIELTYSGGGAVKVLVYVNGRELPVSMAKGAVSASRKVRIMGLPQDERELCIIHLVFLDSEGNKVSEQDRELRYVDPHRRLHLFCAGVGGIMDDPAFAPLVFPRYDAAKVRDCMVEHASSFYELKSQVLLYTERETRRGPVMEEFRRFCDRTEDGDVAMIYLSGHGVEESGEFYFIARDTSNEDLANTAVSGEFMRDCFRGMTDRNVTVFVFMDACHAESLFKDKVADDWQTVYYASSMAEQMSEERRDWKNSAWAMAFIAAFSGEDGSAHGPDGIITIKGLQNYLVQKVEKETMNAQTPVWHDTGLGDSYPIFRVSASGHEQAVFTPLNPSNPDYRVLVRNTEGSFVFRWNPEGVKRLRLSLQDKDGNIVLRKDFTREDHYNFAVSAGLRLGSVSWTIAVEYEDGNEGRGSGVVSFVKAKN